MASMAFGAAPVVLLPSTFSFVQVEDSDAPASELPLWALRGENTAEAVRMMSFCDTGVTSGQSENFGLMPIRKIAGPMTLVIGPGFAPEEKAIIVDVSAEKQWPVPLAVQEGAVDGVPPDGFIYVTRDLNLRGTAGAYPVTKNNVAVAGGVIVGRWVLTKYVMRHELGHVVMGLCHHNLPGIMSGRPLEDGQFSKAELDNANMSLLLAPNTCFPGTTQKGLVCSGGQASSKSSLDSGSFVLILE